MNGDAYPQIKPEVWAAAGAEREAFEAVVARIASINERDELGAAEGSERPTTADYFDLGQDLYHALKDLQAKLGGGYHAFRYRGRIWFPVASTLLIPPCGMGIWERNILSLD